jgi:hypothetical protein
MSPAKSLSILLLGVTPDMRFAGWASKRKFAGKSPLEPAKNAPA